MEHALSSTARRYFAEIAKAEVLIAFDYDGTLAPIHNDPASAFMRATTVRLLDELTALYPCGVISGRTKSDTLRMLGECDLALVAGNHGLDPSPGLARFERLVSQWRTQAMRLTTQLEGTTVEDKRYALAIHYRRSRSKKKVVRALEAFVETFSGARVIWGKQVCNLVPAGAPHKGMALERMRDALGCRLAIYLGDDQSDEDAFLLDEPGRLVGVRVGRDEHSAASYFLRSQREVDAMLSLLIEARAGATSGRVSDGSAIDGMWMLQAFRALESALDRNTELNLSQRLILRLMAHHPGISAGMLAQRLHVHPSTLTADFKVLETRRLIERRADPKDSRRALFVLSSRGRTIDEQAEDALNTLDRALASLPPAKRVLTGRVLEQLVSAVG